MEGREPSKYCVEDAKLCKIALECLHAKNIVHCDPRPQNFVIVQKDNRDEARIIDFGFSERTESKTQKEKDMNLFYQHFPRLLPATSTD